MSNKKLLGYSLVVFGFILLALTGIRTISSPDIFTHLALGQSHGSEISYTMAGHPWINMTPLYNRLSAMRSASRSASSSSTLQESFVTRPSQSPATRARPAEGRT